ncbi:hypothetical protein VNI00_001422 [Paramarasmius palmivorus]|uniref:Uncharacterized protein n=1 Tax=Paramarasmius palmivorus TaxID=297713 RepID=A0AAW0E0N3_9AGAR
MNGHCMRTNCAYTHETAETTIQNQLSSPEVKEEAVGEQPSDPRSNEQVQPLSQDDRDVQERQIYSCTVTFGRGASVVHVSTAFESCRVLVTFSGTVAENELDKLGSLYGDLTSRVSLRPSGQGSLMTAVLEFATPTQAAAASQGMHEVVMNETRLNASLDLRSSVTDRGTTGILRNSKVKVSWFSPTTTAFLHYDDRLQAMSMATQLDGRIVGGRKVKASFQKPTFNQRRSFTVIVNGLPAHNLNWKNYLRKHSNANSIDITNKESLLHEDMCGRARAVLERHGIVESFDALALDPTKPKTVAFAQFATAESAAEAVAALHGTKRSELGNSPIWVELVFSVKYSVPAERFACMRAELDTLRDAHGDAKMGYYDKDEHGIPISNVTLRVYGADAKAVASLKLSVERVLAGEQIQVDGSCVWDDIFLEKRGGDFLRTLGVREEAENVHVYADTRLRCLRLFGDTRSKASARKAILVYLEQQRANPQAVTLSPKTYRLILNGRLGQLERIAGKDGVILDIVKQEVRVRKAESLRNVQLFIQHIEDEKGGDYVADVLCSVCFCDPAETGEEAIVLDCRHVYCQECLRGLCLSRSSGTSFAPLNCVASSGAGSCEQCIPYSVLRNSLSSEAEAQLLEASFVSYIHLHHHDFRFCPTPDCPTIYRANQSGDTLQCPNCLVRICTLCDVEYHDGLSCAVYKDIQSGGMELHKKWREENGVKACPNCGMDIMKSDGCNHMTCTVCKSHICWTCLKLCTVDNIYDHMNREHGGIGIE